MGVPKTSDHVQIKIKMLNPSQEPTASFKAQNQDLKDMSVLCIFKNKIENQNLELEIFQYLPNFSKEYSQLTDIKENLN